LISGPELRLQQPLANFTYTQLVTWGDKKLKLH